MINKIYHIVPHYSVVGLLLRHHDDVISVKATRKDIVAHSVFTWEVVGDSFVREPLSRLSINLDKSISNFIINCISILNPVCYNIE